jgi:hypothetical protein
LDQEPCSSIAHAQKGYRTLRVKQHDRAALTLLARVLGMLINRSEISGPGGKPVEVDHSVDHSARIRSRLDEIAKRLPAPSEQPMPIVDVMPQKATPGALLAARLRDTGEHE